MEQLADSGLRKEYDRAVYCHSIYLTYTQNKHIIRNAGLDELEARIKIAGRDTNNFRYTDTTLMAKSEEELKNFLMRVKEESEKAHLKLNIKTKIKASSAIISWQIEGEKNGNSDRLYFIGLQNHCTW